MRKMSAVLVLLGALAMPAQATDYVTPGLLIFGSNAVDLATTNAALARGGRELNPLMRSASGRIAVKATVGAGVYALHVHLARKGRKRAAWVATGCYVAANLAVSLSNSRQRAR